MEDEIMTELHRIREEYAAKHGYDLTSMAKGYREFTTAHGMDISSGTVCRIQQAVPEVNDATQLSASRTQTVS